MTLRRLLVLIRALPVDCPLYAELDAAEEQAQKATPDELRSRQAEWERRNAEQRAKEATQ